MSAIGVVVATCGRPLELEACLDSLLAQTLPPALVVVVDDAPGGHDTPAAVARKAGSGPVRYVEGARAGLAAAHNRGLEEVTTDLVAFTDDDVVAEPDWLARVVAAFAAAPRAACVTGRIVPFELATPAQVMLDGYAGFDKGRERHVFDLAARGAGADAALLPWATGAVGSGANMAFRRDALLAQGAFDPALGAGTRARGGDDLAAFYEVLRRGHQVVYEPAAVVRHRHRRDLETLPGQVFGYGVGLTAHLARCAVQEPAAIPAAARRLPLALRHVLHPASTKNARLPPGWPPALRRRERLGMLVGPAAYLLSRLDVARAR